MTTVTLTFKADSATGKAAGEAIAALEDNNLSDSEKLAVTQWLYVSYRVAEDVQVNEIGTVA